MRSFHEMEQELAALPKMLDKYARISRMPFDFGLDQPLYPTEVHVVSEVVARGPASVTDLGRRFGVTRGAASQMVGKLVQKGLLSKRQDPEKGSRWLVEATEQGRNVHDHHMAFHREHDKEFMEYLGRLSEAEFATVASLFKRMERWLDSYFDG